MRIQLVSPMSLDEVGGNVTTITRLRDALRARGHDVACIVAGDDCEIDRPEVVHAFHAIRSGPRGLALAARYGVPLVVTLTGTDLRPPDGLTESAAARLGAVVERASAVVAFDAAMRDELTAACRAPLIEVIPQATPPMPDGDRAEGRRLLRAPDDALLFLMVAGVRPVKQAALPIAPLSRLRAAAPTLAYRVIGPRLDDDCARDLEARLAAAGDWAQWVPPVARSQMPHVYAAADVVVNASISEGMSGALLEAMALGRAVLAVDIPANRAIVDHDVEGLRFDGDDAFIAAARRLLEPDTRARLGQGGRRRPLFPVDEEVRRHVRLYERVMASTPGTSATRP